MPEYAFECRACGKAFTLVMRISERQQAKIVCPGCGGGDVVSVMQPFVARTARKS